MKTDDAAGVNGPRGRPLSVLLSEPVLFWFLVALHVAPIWAFRFLPTQDGPAHLFNSFILKDYGDPAAGYDAIFELRFSPLPNLTSHVLLAGLLFLFPPLIAEKVLVSFYIIGFAWSYRFFLGGFGERCRPLSWLGLVFVFNRCFWLGFWNYCLGLIFVWVTLGYMLRRRGTLHPSQPAILMLLFMGAFFTHLIAFLLCFSGALLISVLTAPRRWAMPLFIVLAALPAACLSMDYFERTGFFKARSAMQLFSHPVGFFQPNQIGPRLKQDIAALDGELFRHHARLPVSLGLFIAPLFVFLIVVRLVDRGEEEFEDEDVVIVDDTPGFLFPAVFGFLLLVGYFLVPNHLGFEHGGFLKTRLAMLPPLLWLACLREPSLLPLRVLFRGLTSVLLLTNLYFVTGTIAESQEVLREFTAGVEAAGHGKRIFVIQPEPTPHPLVNPLLHAPNHYCLGTSNINLDNYEASTPHFPVMFRQGVERGRGSLVAYPNRDKVDVLLVWQTHKGFEVRAPAGWPEIFREGRLKLYRRPGT